MNVKTGVQAWSSKPQPGIRHSDNVHTNSAGDEGKVFGPNQNLGDTLNKIADPNYVDPSKKIRTVGSNELGKDAFMTLLLTQMKNQDPTNPLKSHEMAAQLAQFTSLEKLTNIDQGIGHLRADAHPDRNFEALSLIGKTVVTDSSKFSRLEQKGNSDIRFRLAADSTKTTVAIKDKQGNVVRTLTLNNLKEGKDSLGTVEWKMEPRFNPGSTLCRWRRAVQTMPRFLYRRELRASSQESTLRRTARRF